MEKSRFLYYLSKSLFILAIGSLLYSLYIKGSGGEDENIAMIGYTSFLFGFIIEYKLKKSKGNEKES